MLITLVCVCSTLSSDKPTACSHAIQTQIQPEGMHLIPLPFMDDLRSPETDEKVVGASLQVGCQGCVNVGADRSRSRGSTPAP